MQPEPVSPELVLVDPALAERERARLVEQALLADRERARLVEQARLAERERALLAEQARLAEFDVELLRRAVEHDAEAADEYHDEQEVAPSRDLRVFARQKLLPVVLACSLFANGIVAAIFVVHADGGSGAAVASPAPVVVTVTAPSTALPQATGTSTTASVARTSQKLNGKAVAEQKLVALMLKSPARKLPHKFVDPTTGLVRNNVRVICTRSRHKTYVCRVALLGDPPGTGLLVRYRPGTHGKERYTWYGYRRAAGASRSTPNS